MRDRAEREAVRRGSFTAPGTPERKGWFSPSGKFNVSVWGTFTGELVLERLLPGEDVWLPVSRDLSGQVASFTAAVSLSSEEAEQGTLYRFRATALTAGEAFWRLSQ